MEVLVVFLFLILIAFDIVVFIDIEHLVDNTLDIDKQLRKLKKRGLK